MFATERAPRGAQAGFTLLEMLVALAIVALLAALAPRLAAPEAGALDRAARLVATELRAARAEALETGADRFVAFDPEAGTLRREGAAPASLPAGVRMALRAAAEAEAAVGAPAILFFGAGGSTGGDVALARGEATAVVSVRWLTGAVRRD